LLIEGAWSNSERQFTRRKSHLGCLVYLQRGLEHSQSSSAAIKPLAVCDFNNRGTCGWKSEETDLGHRWMSEQGSICLKSRPSSVHSPNSEDSSWLQELSDDSSDVEADIITRFKSPSIKAAVGLKYVIIECVSFLLESSSIIKPLAICDFNNKKTCGWFNEETDWSHRWIPENGSLCLKAKHFLAEVSNSDESSWLQELSAASSEKEADITIRFKSPPIKVVVGLKCIGFDYSISFSSGEKSKSAGKSPSLSLLQQQKGYLSIDRFFQFASPIIKPLAICDFNKGGACGWKIEETDLGHRWTPDYGSFCLKASQSSSPVKKSEESSWFEGLSAELPKKDININARFKSPLIPSSVSLKCLAFAYLINRGHGKGSKAVEMPATLSLLQQQKGAFFPCFSKSLFPGAYLIDQNRSLFLSDISPSNVQPLAVCNFDKGGTCGWINDETDWRHQWRVEQGSLCLKVKLSSTPIQNLEESSWFQGLTAKSPKKKVDITTRFKSPPIPVSVGLKCIGFDYSINLYQAKNFSTSIVKPLAICDFNNGGTCGWKSEETDLGHRWIPEQGFLCLTGQQSSGSVQNSGESEDWLDGFSVDLPKSVTDITVRFKSRLIPSSVVLKCLGFTYSINLGSSEIVETSFLSLLQQQKGYLFVEFSPLDLQPLAICDFDDGDTCDWKSEETDLGHRWKPNQGSLCLEAKLSSPPVKKSKPSSWFKGLSAGSSKKDLDINTQISSPIIKPLAVCDFGNGGTCGWFNEEAEWKHRWKIDQGSLCLKAKQPSSLSQNTEAHWIPGIFSEIPVETDVTARFKSPSVPPSVGLKCVDFVYSINLGRKGSSKVVKASTSLSLLQQQKGWIYASSKPLAICDFNNGGTCGWKSEETYLAHRWITEHGLLCLKAKQSSVISKDSDVSFWLPGLSAESTKEETDVTSRFKSPSVPSSFGLKCIGFDYSVNLGHGKNSKTSNTSAKPPHLDIKPLAICDFDDGEACGWINEESDLKRQWIINQGSLCLKAKQYSAKSLHSKASWIPGIASETREVETDVTARFKSPSVPPSIGLKCIGFVYSVNLGKSSKTVDNSASLALLQQQKGYLLISSNFLLSVIKSKFFYVNVPSTLLFLFSLSPLESLESSRQAPLAVCDFDDGDTCGWVHEEAVWTHQWSVQARSLCLKAKSILPQKKKSSSWFADRSVDKPSDSLKEVSVRFTSPPIPSVVNLKCIAFSYSMDLGHGKISESMGSLSLLQQQKGCLFHLPSLLHVWTFDEGDMEEWTNDIDNWQQKWRIMETNLPSSSICVSAKLPRKSSSKKFSLVSTLVAKKSLSRFWSPGVSGRLGIKCFSLQFIIEKAGGGANLALLQQSSG
uniref:MAM domain-containing protein n=1 Tax=Hymenolepis diminuta TaxID=6216 RepID=A0A158QFA7_HYMDI